MSTSPANHRPRLRRPPTSGASVFPPENFERIIWNERYSLEERLDACTKWLEFARKDLGLVEDMMSKKDLISTLEGIQAYLERELKAKQEGAR
jgi:hypothetical protein